MVERKCGARGEFVESGCLDAGGNGPAEGEVKEAGEGGDDRSTTLVLLAACLVTTDCQQLQ